MNEDYDYEEEGYFERYSGHVGSFYEDLYYRTIGFINSILESKSSSRI